MKFALSFALGLATAGTLVAAQPHNHRHRHAGRHHAGKRAPVPLPDVITVTEFRMDNGGTTLPTSEATAAIHAGYLAFDEVQPSPPASSSTPVASPPSSPPSAPLPSKPVVAAQFYDLPANSSIASSSPITSAPTSSSSFSTAVSSPAPASSSPASSPSSVPSTGQGLDSDFPDGTLDCSQFPSDYGPIALDYLGLGGWSGIQAAGNYANYANGQGTCTEGDFCSYACPAGYQKSQWPTPQPASGQSVGGITCTGGKLKLTNSGLSSKLCIPGNGQVMIQNKIGSVASVCRTDYPGTEGETIPLQTESGQSYQLTCPVAEDYYSWEGGKTSAQYYLNPIGVTSDKACQWDTPGSEMGNYAPVVRWI